MAKFFYTARSSQGEIEKGKLEVKDKKALARILREKGLLLTSARKIEKEKKKMSLKKFFPFLKRVSSMEKILFTRHLKVMLSAGISLNNAFSILEKQTGNKYFKEVIFDLNEETKKGESFFESLKKYPKIFPPLYTSMIETGEISGKLEDCLNQLSIQMKKEYDLVTKVRGAMTYPIVVLLVVVGIVIFVMTTVIPKLSEVFKEAGVELPLPTKILIAASDFFVNQGFLVVFGFFILIFLTLRFLRTKFGRRLSHFLILKTPVFSMIVKKVNLARFSRTICALLTSKISVISALKITGNNLGNFYYKKALFEASEEIKKGITIAEILSKYKKIFPTMVWQMIEIGEKTGNLEEILLNLAQFYEEEVDELMKAFSSIIEPILLVVLGVIAAGVALAVITPIYSLVQQF